VICDPFFTTVPNEEDPELIDLHRISLDNLLDAHTGQG
jgi:hypothetical protein